MKHRLTVIIDILTILFVVPFLFFMTAMTGLVVAFAFGLDTYFVPSPKTETRLHIRRLPPLDIATAEAASPAPAEPAVAEVIMPIESAPEQPEVTSTEPQNSDEVIALVSAPAENLAAVEVPAEPIALESAPSETAVEEVAPVETTAASQDNTPEVTENPALEQEPASPEPTSPETAEDTEETPVVSAPTENIEPEPPIATAQNEPPIQTQPSEPAPVPDVSYFDKLLEQVKP